MKTLLKRPKNTEALARVLDTLSLFSVLQYCVYRFLQSTMFNFYYSQRYKLITMGLLIIFGGIRYVYIVINKLKGYKEKKEKKKYVLRCGAAWILALPFFYVGWLHDYKNLILLPICCMCLYDMEAEKVCRRFSFLIGILLAATILCSLSGTVNNLVFTWKKNEASYGIINTTDFAAYFVFVPLFMLCGRRLRSWQEEVVFIVTLIVINCIVYQIAGSKTSLLCGILIILHEIYECQRGIAIRKRGTNKAERNTLLPIISFPAIGVFTAFLLIWYKTEHPWAMELDKLLTGRLGLTLQSFSTYGIHAFGNKIENLHGNGGTIINYGWSSGYGYIDNSYALISIKYGWIVTGIILGLWVWTAFRAVKSGKQWMAFAICIMSIHAFSEARIMDINYNILLAMPFCSIFGEKENKRDPNTTRCKCWIPSFLAIVFSGIIILLLPRVLSWLRTFFYLKQWNGGTKAILSLVTCFVLSLGVWGLWKTSYLLWIRPRRINKILMVCTISIFVTGVLYINHEIVAGTMNQIKRLEKEKPIVAQIKSASSQPVYVAEQEELYQRNIGGFSNHIFSTEELAKIREGTIFTDSGIEAIGVARAGALYTQISESSGIYTYDPAVISTLTGLGYDMKPFYSGLRYCNLIDTAKFNEMDIIKEGLVIVGPKEVITKNAEVDQLTGTYEVVFSISSISTAKENAEITLGVLGQAGEQIIISETKKIERCEANSQNTYVLSYHIQNTPKVSFFISIPDGVSIVWDSLSWKRIE